MKLNVQGQETFVSTGGRAVFDPGGDVLLFIHGSGQSHLSWMLQGRFFANRGWQVLAPDLPGHGLSGGEPLKSIAEMADWCAELLSAAGVERATVIGHSQGGLVALEMVHRHPQIVSKLALVACALAIPVNPALLELAKNSEHKAIKAMIDWSHAAIGHFHDHTMPGQSHVNFGVRLMANNVPGALYADLQACAHYRGGKAAAQAVSCPVLCILAGHDRMTPIKFGRLMAAALPRADVREIPESGHMLASEQPLLTNLALREFFSTKIVNQEVPATTQSPRPLEPDVGQCACTAKG